MRVAVEAGQVYRIPRPGKPAQWVKVKAVDVKDPNQPKIRYVPITRTGAEKSLGLGDQRKWDKKVATIPTRAQFRDGAWRAPPGWELVEETS